MGTDVSIEAMVEQLWAIEQIKQLKARYCRSFDTRDWETFADCFTEDCRHTWGEDFAETFRSREEYLAHARTAIVPGVSVHQCSMPEIEIVGPTDARGTWAMMDYVETAEGARTPGRFRGYGYYIEEYKREADGRWRISAKHLQRLRVDQEPRQDA